MSYKENDTAEVDTVPVRPTGEDRGSSVGNNDTDRAEYMDGVPFGD